MSKSISRAALTCIAVVLFGLLPATVFGGNFVAFGPQSYTRTTGSPAVVSNAFSVLNSNTTYTLQIYNGGLTDGEFEKVSSSVISINGVQVVGPNEFNQKVSLIEKPVTLGASNQLAVELRGKPGGGITIQIIGVDDAPPTITAAVNPAPNAAGWHKSNATVSFTCGDTTSGLASCPAPITVSAEAASQVVSGTATDRAGNSATVSVTIKLDKSAPALAITSPSNGASVSSSPARVSSAASDSLSGLATVLCNGSPASLSNSSFSCDAPVTNGSNLITVEATDLAGNASSSSVTVVLDNAPPTITAAVNPVPNAAGWHKSNVTVSFSCADAASGIASCSAPVVVTTEGAGQAISGTAVDLAGNSAVTSVTLNIDKSPPAIAISSPANGAKLSASPFSVTGTIAETLSGIAGIGCNGFNATFSTSTFTCNVPLVNGVNTIVVDAIDVAGNAASSTISVNFVPGPAVTITSPTSGSTLNASSVLVRGVVDVPAGTEVGVTVNGFPAAVQGSVFVALVPVTPETASLTTVATTAAGVTANHSIAISVSAASAPAVTLLVSPKSGVAPLTVALSLFGSANISSIDLDFDGNGTVDFTGQSLDGQTFTYTQPNIYVPSVRITDAQGNQQTAIAIVQIFDRTALDTLLQPKWNGLKDALGHGDIVGAISFVADGEKERYRGMFERLMPDLPSVSANLNNITPVTFQAGIVEYATTQFRDGGNFIHFVYFMQDRDGIWKIVAM